MSLRSGSQYLDDDSDDSSVGHDTATAEDLDAERIRKETLEWEAQKMLQREVEDLEKTFDGMSGDLKPLYETLGNEKKMSMNSKIAIYRVLANIDWAEKLCFDVHCLLNRANTDKVDYFVDIMNQFPKPTLLHFIELFAGMHEQVTFELLESFPSARRMFL